METGALLLGEAGPGGRWKVASLQGPVSISGKFRNWVTVV